MPDAVSELRALADSFGYPELWHEYGLLDLGTLLTDVAALDDDPRTERSRARAFARLVDGRSRWSDGAFARFLRLIEAEPDATVADEALTGLVESGTLSGPQLRLLTKDDRWSSVSARARDELLMKAVAEDVGGLDARLTAAVQGGRRAHLFLLALPTLQAAVLEVLAERGADRSIRNQARDVLRRRGGAERDTG